MIKLNSICGGYGKKQIISDINITFKENRVTTIVGANGCGKSTLLQHVAGLLKPFGGSLVINNKSISDYGRNELARTVSYLPQLKNVGSITVRSLVSHGRFPYLGYPRKYSSDDKEKINNALMLAGVADISDSLITELSGGQQQKVFIAMSLAQDTPIVLLDEPITHLDINYQLELMELIVKLKGLSKTVVMVLHDLNLALQFSDRVAVMQDGGIKAFGKPHTIAESGIFGTVFGVETMYSKDINQYFFRKG